ncbi:phosphoglycerate mutase, partial [Streptomyces erythrochromogenes]
MATLILVRHGRSTANTAGLLAGWTPGVALDERGAERRQTRGTLHRVAPAARARYAAVREEKCEVSRRPR